MGRPNIKNTTASRAEKKNNNQIRNLERIKLTNFLTDYYSTIKYQQRTWHIKRNIFEIQKCVCGNPKIFIEKRYKFCSKECTSKSTVKNRKKTNIEKYGVENAYQSSLVKNKIRKTCMERYGFSNGGLTNFRYKSFILPSGRTIRLQGFEDIALKELLIKYPENDILYGPKEIHQRIGFIYYEHDGIIRRYYPDFYIISENRIIEVKSKWTFDKKGKDKSMRNKNLLKKKASINKGHLFTFIIY